MRDSTYGVALHSRLSHGGSRGVGIDTVSNNVLLARHYAPTNQEFGGPLLNGEVGQRGDREGTIGIYRDAASTIPAEGIRGPVKAVLFPVPCRWRRTHGH